MIQQPRFQFPGFAIVAAKDTDTHEVEIGAIEDGGRRYVLELVRNKKMNHLPFLISKVTFDGELVWTFKGSGWTGLGNLANTNRGPVIALVGAGKGGKVQRVIPLFIFKGPRADIRVLSDLKRQAAEFLGLDYEASESERMVMRAFTAKERERQQAEKDEAHAQRAAEREERVRAIMARGRAVGYTADGSKRHGLPVLEGEWQGLSNGTFVILVESVKGGEIGNFIEAFQVNKTNGRHPSKAAIAVVTKDKPEYLAVAQPTVITPSGITVVEMKDGVFEVDLYASMDDIRTARAQGLNNGAFVAVKPVPGKKVQVLAVYKDRVESMGDFFPIQA